ncbi:MAG: PFL family protein [Anaerolineaceae bacterium]|nr:MAG: PFL family protein [Anaerolineaceae bacterium]
MKIRSITYFCNPGYPLKENILREAGDFLSGAKSAYEAAGYEVQTVRVATVSFAKLLGEKHLDELPAYAEKFTKTMNQTGVSFAALGPALPELPRSYQVIPDAIAASEGVFFSGVMADAQTIHMARAKACAEIIVRSAPLDPDGFANLHFTALANVGANAPFFPGAYHTSDQPAFGIAVECADLAVNAFHGQKTVDGGRNLLIAEITKHGQAITKLAQELTHHASRITFKGIDFSLAPFPDDAYSLGKAVENMGVPKIGLHGSLAAAAVLTDAIERADFPHIGFNGFMQPILEDTILAKRAAEGVLTVKDALLYSAVCGTGLDTVPLAGDVTAEEITPLLLDICALALRLNKPLTARLMPIPGKKAGDATTFDFAFFANGRVMALESSPLTGAFNHDSGFRLNPKRPE